MGIASGARDALDANDHLLTEALEGGVLEEDVKALERSVVNLEQVAIFLATGPDSSDADFAQVPMVMSQVDSFVASLPDPYGRYDAHC